MRWFTLVTVGSWLGLLGACGGTDSGSTSNDDVGVSIDDLPAKYADAFCQAFTNCAGELYDVFRPGESCVKNSTTAFTEELATLPDAIDAGRVKYHASKVQACLDEVAGFDCSKLDDRSPPSCKAAVEGTVPTGGDCSMDAECAGEQYCKLGSSCPGKCEPYEKAGGACSADANCASGLKCGETSHCVAPAKQGEACKQGEPDCAAGFVCLGEDAKTKMPGKCISIDSAFSGKAGDDCALDSSLCGSTLSCEITSIAPLGGSCVARVDSGAECHAAVPDECPDDQYCELGLNPLLPGKCTNKPAAGEKCGNGLGAASICAPYARCDDGVCREIAHAGEQCHANDTCYSGHCDGGACVTGSSCH